jgi:hypothetical protein
MNDNDSRPTARPHPLDASIHWIEPRKLLRYLALVVVLESGWVEQVIDRWLESWHSKG